LQAKLTGEKLKG